jgi:hypothetical protein
LTVPITGATTAWHSAPQFFNSNVARTGTTRAFCTLRTSQQTINDTPIRPPTNDVKNKWFAD